MADLTIAEASKIADVLMAVQRNSKITWFPRGDEDMNPIEGVLRYFTDEPLNASYATWSHGDVRDKWIRVSATFEHWIAVRDLLEWLYNGKAFVSNLK